MMRIGIVGIGPVGRTPGTIWARAGHEAFGSRDPVRAAEAVIVLWTPRGVTPSDPDMLAGKIVVDADDREPAGAGVR